MIFTILAGMILPVQALLNAKMGKAIQSPVYASLVSFIVGSIALFIYAAFTKVNFSNITNSFSLSYSVWLAGILGAFYVTAVLILTPKLGATLTFSLIIAGQLGIAIFLDHFGLLGVSTHLFNWYRFFGIMLILIGVVLIRLF